MSGFFLETMAVFKAAPFRNRQAARANELLKVHMSDARVLMVIPTLKVVGGAQDQLRLLSDELNRVGFRHDVKGLDSLGALSPRREGVVGMIAYVAQALVWYTSVVFVLLQWGRKYDVVHLHGLGFPLFVLGFLSRMSKFRLVVKVPRSGAGSYIQTLSFRGIRRICFLFFCAKAYRFVALTEDAKVDLQNAGVEEARITRIPNGVRIPEVPNNGSFSARTHCLRGSVN